MFLETPTKSDNASVVKADDFDVQKLYHSVSVVGTLLLQIGEVGQRVTSETKENKKISLENDKDWSITFQQFLASFLNESCLVDFFESKVDLSAGLKKLNQVRLQRQESIPLMSKSVFYV